MTDTDRCAQHKPMFGKEEYCTGARSCKKLSEGKIPVDCPIKKIPDAKPVKKAKKVKITGNVKTVAVTTPGSFTISGLKEGESPTTTSTATITGAEQTTPNMEVPHKSPSKSPAKHPSSPPSKFKSPAQKAADARVHSAALMALKQPVVSAEPTISTPSQEIVKIYGSNTNLALQTMHKRIQGHVSVESKVATLLTIIERLEAKIDGINARIPYTVGTWPSPVPANPLPIGPCDPVTNPWVPNLPYPYQVPNQPLRTGTGTGSGDMPEGGWSQSGQPSVGPLQFSLTSGDIEKIDAVVKNRCSGISTDLQGMIRSL